MSDAALPLVERVIAHLRTHPDDYVEPAEPHPCAAALALPGGAAAPATLRAWAAFDRRYPWYLSSRRSDQEIADGSGTLIVQPMKQVLQYVCLDSIRDELEGDDDTVRYLNDRVADLAEAHPGHGVYLRPDEHPDRMLWLPPGAEPVVLWYEHDTIAARRTFAEYLSELFFDE